MNTNDARSSIPDSAKAHTTRLMTDSRKGVMNHCFPPAPVCITAMCIDESLRYGMAPPQISKPGLITDNGYQRSSMNGQPLKTQADN